MSKLVGIHEEPLGQLSNTLKKYEIILNYNKLNTQRVNSNDLDFWEKIKNLDLFIYHWSHRDSERQVSKSILPIVEHVLKIQCYPDMHTCWAFDDKIREFYLMKNKGFPIAKSWIFWDELQALHWAKKIGLPIVFKLSGGAGSKNVILIKDRKKMNQLIKRMFHKGIMDGRIPDENSLGPNFFLKIKRILSIYKRRLLNQKIPFYQEIPNWHIHRNYVYFQEFLPNNKYDTRVTTIGDRAFAFKRLIRRDDFRASGSKVKIIDPKGIDLNFVKEALRISKQMKFQSMAYDFLYGNNNTIQFIEMSYTFPDTTLYSIPGYWDSELNWHEGHYWPQYLILKDLLKSPDLKQPQITF